MIKQEKIEIERTECRCDSCGKILYSYQEYEGFKNFMEKKPIYLVELYEIDNYCPYYLNGAIHPRPMIHHKSIRRSKDYHICSSDCLIKLLYNTFASSEDTPFGRLEQPGIQVKPVKVKLEKKENKEIPKLIDIMEDDNK